MVKIKRTLISIFLILILFASYYIYKDLVDVGHKKTTYNLATTSGILYFLNTTCNSGETLRFNQNSGLFYCEAMNLSFQAQCTSGNILNWNEFIKCYYFSSIQISVSKNNGRWNAFINDDKLPIKCRSEKDVCGVKLTFNKKNQNVLNCQLEGHERTSNLEIDHYQLTKLEDLIQIELAVKSDNKNVFRSIKIRCDSINSKLDYSKVEALVGL